MLAEGARGFKPSTLAEAIILRNPNVSALQRRDGSLSVAPVDPMQVITDLNVFARDVARELKADSSIDIRPGKLQDESGTAPRGGWSAVVLPQVTVIPKIHDLDERRITVTVYPDPELIFLYDMYEEDANNIRVANPPQYPPGTQNDLEKLGDQLTIELFNRWRASEDMRTYYFTKEGLFIPRLYYGGKTLAVTSRSERCARVRIWTEHIERATEEIVRVAGMSEKRFGQIEAGEVEPTDLEYNNIAHALMLTVEQMDSLQLPTNRPIMRDRKLEDVFEEVVLKKVPRDFIRLLRQDRGWTPAQAGARLGWSQVTMSAVELGKFTPTPSMIDQIVEAWDLTPEEQSKLKKLIEDER